MASRSGPVRVLLVDDHDLVRVAIRRLLESSGRDILIDEAGDAESALSMAREHSPDLVMLDITMPGIGGIEATKRFRHFFPHIKVLILTAHNEGLFPRRVLSEGAHGYITKGCSEMEMLTAIDRVLGGGKYIALEIAQRLAMDAIEGHDGSPFDNLSSRELQTVLMTAKGKRNNEIADALHVSPKTISTYRSRAMEKLNVDSTGGLVRLAMQHGLIESGAD